MHNLLLGIIKTQWYTQWILTPALRAATQTRTRELDLMHTFLSTFEAPLWAGKLPLHVREPAGGSLTADEYKFAATTAWPITKSAKDDKEPKPPKPPKVRMQRDEPINFLHLSTALKIFCGSSIKLDMLPRLYSVDALKPNFHWAVHLRRQILDYGPVYNFWASLSERLNKVLKSSNSNNWTGGQIEISMMREFARGAQIDSLVISLPVIVLSLTRIFRLMMQ
ncbi:hypothetical protein BDR03DRAFT_936515 [Suillus americanus]|nr:hypothetical protein BDR03DRAFT_936515 [Suillus americanus]